MQRSEESKAKQREYQKTDERKQYQREYKSLDKYKKQQKLYRLSLRYKECLKKCSSSEKYKKYHKEYAKNYNKSEKFRVYQKQWYKKRRDAGLMAKYAREYCRDRFKKDIGFKLVVYMRCRLRSAIKQNQKTGSAVEDLGCSIDELRVYLEKQFQEGMSWENWTRIDLHEKAWNIDHVKPLSLFDLTDRKQFLEACHYSNLQPMWAIDNLRKGAKTNFRVGN